MTLSAGNPNTESLPSLTPVSGDDPSWLPDKWRNDLWPLWRIVKDVYDGFHHDHVKRRYLIQAEGENPFEYDARVQGAYLDEHFRITLEKNAGLIAQFDVEPDSPEELLDEEFVKNIDNQGNSLKAFAQKTLSRVFRDEFCLLGVSIPDAFGDSSDDEREAYFTLTDARDIRAPLVQYVDKNGLPSRSGSLALTRVSIRRWVQIPVGEYAYEWRQEFWVYRLVGGICTLQIFEAPSHFSNGVDEQLTDDAEIAIAVPIPVTELAVVKDAAGRPLKQLPFIWYHIDKDANIGDPGTPPLLYLAETMITWFNKESQLDAAERRCNLPTPAQGHPGGVPSNPEDVRLGPGAVWHYDAAGDVKFVEPSGKALASTHERQKHRENRVQRIDERFIGATSGGVSLTATAVKLADRVSKITLELISQSLETAFAELFKLFALMTDPTYEPGDPAGGIRISRSVLEGTLQSTEIAVLLSALQEQGIDRFEFRAMMKLQSLQLTDDVLTLAERLRKDFESENPNGIDLVGDPALFAATSDLAVPPGGQIAGQPAAGSQQSQAQAINRSAGDEALAESINEQSA